MIRGAAILETVGLAQVAAAPALAAALLGPVAVVDLDWQAPPGCPPAAAIQADIERSLSAYQTAAAVRVSGVVSKVDAGRWRVDLALQGPGWKGTRTLEGPSCAAVSEAAGLVIVLAVNTELQARETKSPPAPPPPAPPVGEPPTKGPFMALGAAVDVGGLPQAAMGATLSLGWNLARVRLDLGATYFVPQQAVVPGQTEIGARFKMGAVDLGACYQLKRAGWAVGPCADVGLNVTHGTGFGPIRAGEATSLAAMLGGGMLAEWLVSRHIALYLAAGAVIPLRRPEFSVEDVGGVHRAARVLFRTASGVELRFK